MSGSYLPHKAAFTEDRHGYTKQSKLGLRGGENSRRAHPPLAAVLHRPDWPYWLRRVQGPRSNEVETGHTLSVPDYARLQKIADALPGDVVFYRTKDQPPPIQFVSLVRYAYTFRPGVDVIKLDGIIIGRCAGDPGDAAKAAADLPVKLAKRLTEDGLPARVGLSDTPDAYVLSGTVTEASTAGHAIDAATETQVEATISRRGAVLGVMQVNAAVPAAVSISPVVQLLSLAMQDSRAWAVSGRISEALRPAKSGQ